MSRALLDDLKARQIAFLEAHLVSEAAAKQWREHLPAGWGALLATPLGELVDAEAAGRLLDALAADEQVRTALRPAAAAVVKAVVEAARAERGRVKGFVPEASQAKLDRILEQPKLVNERLLREALENPALDAVMRDVLYDALKDFSDKVNPFFAEWGLPALLKKVMPLGAGTLMKSLGLLKDEFERRLEPELRKFLQGASRRALSETASLLIAKSDSSEFIALRKHIAAWILELEVGALARQLNDRSSALAQEIGLDVAQALLQDEALRKRQREALAGFVAAHAKEPVGEVLKRFGITIVPDFEVLAAVTWPVVRSMAASAPVRGWLASVVSAFFDGLPDDVG